MLMFYVMPEGQFSLDEHGHDEDFVVGRFLSVGPTTSSVANRGSVKPVNLIWRTASVFIMI